MPVINDKTLSDAVELTRSLVRILSMNPPGNEDEIADFVQDVLQGAGIESTRVPPEKGRSSIVARIPGKNSGSIVLCGHLVQCVPMGTSGPILRSPPNWRTIRFAAWERRT